MVFYTVLPLLYMCVLKLFVFQDYCVIALRLKKRLILLNLENCENVTLCIYPVTLSIYHEADCMFLLFYFLNTSTFTFLIVI